MSFSSVNVLSLFTGFDLWAINICKTCGNDKAESMNMNLHSTYIPAKASRQTHRWSEKESDVGTGWEQLGAE